MRRVLVLCLMLMLPLQGAWAVVAGIVAFDAPCAAAQKVGGPAAHGADAGMASDASDETSGAMVDCDGAAFAGACCGGQCGGCGSCSAGHGQAQLALVGVPAVFGVPGVGVDLPACSARGAPDHVPDLPLRPPLARLA